jgi:uncharacterized protein YggL (DUF469 family)
MEANYRKRSLTLGEFIELVYNVCGKFKDGQNH